MQKVEGSSPFSRSFEIPDSSGISCLLGPRPACSSRSLAKSATGESQHAPRLARYTVDGSVHVARRDDLGAIPMVGKIAFAATAVPMATMSIYGGPAGGKHDDRNKQVQLPIGIGMAAGFVAMMASPGGFASGSGRVGVGLLAGGAGVYAGLIGGLIAHEILN